MKALILAAGIGSRLAPLTDSCPKALVKVNGEPIIIKQIDNLYKNHINEIIIVSGYRADILESVVCADYPDITIVNSQDYANTNNMYSAYLAKGKLDNTEFLMMNSDVFYDASVIEKLIHCPEKDMVVTDIGNYLEESMKVVEQNGKLIKISKEITKEEALGSSIDVYKFSAEGGNAFFAKCTEYIEQKRKYNLWSEVALNDIFAEVKFVACPLEGRWVEIDNLDDLKEAEEKFAKKS